MDRFHIRQYQLKREEARLKSKFRNLKKISFLFLKQGRGGVHGSDCKVHIVLFQINEVIASDMQTKALFYATNFSCKLGCPSAFVFL